MRFATRGRKPKADAGTPPADAVTVKRLPKAFAQFLRASTVPVDRIYDEFQQQHQHDPNAAAFTRAAIERKYVALRPDVARPKTKRVKLSPGEAALFAAAAAKGTASDVVVDQIRTKFPSSRSDAELEQLKKQYEHRVAKRSTRAPLDAELEAQIRMSLRLLGPRPALIAKRLNRSHLRRAAKAPRVTATLVRSVMTRELKSATAGRRKYVDHLRDLVTAPFASTAAEHDLALHRFPTTAEELKALVGVFCDGQTRAGEEHTRLQQLGFAVSEDDVAAAAGALGLKRLLARHFRKEDVKALETHALDHGAAATVAEFHSRWPFLQASWFPDLQAALKSYTETGELPASVALHNALRFDATKATAAQRAEARAVFSGIADESLSKKGKVSKVAVQLSAKWRRFVKPIDVSAMVDTSEDDVLELMELIKEHGTEKAAHIIGARRGRAFTAEELKLFEQVYAEPSV